MYDGIRRRRAQLAAGACARDVPVDAHRGSHWDFLYRHRHAAQAAARGTRPQRREFAQCLLARTADLRTIKCAIEQIASEDKAPGPDGLRLDKLSLPERGELARTLSQTVSAGTYWPGPVRRKQIPKTSGSGTRTLEIPNAADKVVQRAVVEAIQPFVNPNFDERSFGFRPGLGREHALCCAELLARQTNRWTWIVEDFQNAFTQVPHQRLLDVLRRLGLDEALMVLIRRVIGNPRGRGLPQGSCLSPLLLNCYCDHFLDRPWRQRHPEVPLIRVADDLLLQVQDAREARHIYAALERLVVPAGLPLKGTPQDAIRLLGEGQPADWLGYRINRGERGVGSYVGPKSWNRLADKLTRAHAKPHAPIRAMEIIKGWTEQLGACYEYEDREPVYARIVSLAHEQAFHEIPSWSEFEDTWEQAYVRFYHLRRVVELHGRQGDTGEPLDGGEGSRQRGEDAEQACPGATPVSAARPQVTIYTDGSCLGSRGVGGWAFMIERPALADWLCQADSHPRTTNNRMEITAVIRGLEMLDEPTSVRIVTDSRYVYDAITEHLPRWQQNRWCRVGGGRLANERLWQRLAALLAEHEVRCEWVRGHSGHLENELVDRLAREAAESHQR